jgi:hypothetical protein
MTGKQRRLGPHLAILVHQLRESSALIEWARERRNAVAIQAASTLSSRQRRPKLGPPDIRFADASEALEWFGDAPRSTVFTWALQDRSGTSLAVSAAAFPVIVMAERDARTTQEFAEELTLHLVASADADGLTWFSEHDGFPVIFSPRSYPSREEALHAATVAVGLLTVATVAGYPFDADTG